MIENNLLGIVLNNPHLYEDLQKYNNLFHDKDCKSLKVILEVLYKKNGGFTYDSIVNHIMENENYSISTFSEIYNSDFLESNYKIYLNDILTRNLKLKLLIYAYEVEDHDYKNYEEIKSDIQTFLDDVQIAKNQEIIDSKKAAWQLLEDHKNKKIIPKIYSGIDFIDRYQGGYDLDDFIILGAKESDGKTSKIIHLIVKQLKKGLRIGFKTCEMPAMKLYKLIACCIAGVDNLKVDKMTMSKQEEAAYIAALEKLYEMPLYILDGPNKWEGLKKDIYDLKKRQDIDIMYIDYLQNIRLMKSGNNSRHEYENMIIISQEIKESCEALLIPHFVLAAITKDGKIDMPRLEHIRGHGQLSNDIDIGIMFCTRDMNYEGSADKRLVEFNIEKNRNGRKGFFKEVFHCAVRRFENIY